MGAAMCVDVKTISKEGYLYRALLESYDTPVPSVPKQKEGQAKKRRIKPSSIKLEQQLEQPSEMNQLQDLIKKFKETQNAMKNFQETTITTIPNSNVLGVPMKKRMTESLSAVSNALVEASNVLVEIENHLGKIR